MGVFVPSPQSITSVTMSFSRSVQPPEAVTFRGALPPGGVTLSEQVGLSAYKNVAEATQKRTNVKNRIRFFACPPITSLESRSSFMSVQDCLAGFMRWEQRF